MGGVFAALLLMISNVATADGSRQTATPIIPDAQWQKIYEDYGFSPALLIGDTVHVSGIIVRLKGEGTYEERYAAGLRGTFAFLERLIEPTGATLDDIIEMTSFHTDIAKQLPTILSVRKSLMNKPHPAWTAVGTTGLADPNGQTEIKFLIKLKPRATNVGR